MSKDTIDVVVAAYRDMGAAQHDFGAVCDLIKGKRVKTEYGVILVSKDTDGKITLADTGDHLGRRGTGWGTGAGVVVDLFAPPLLASVAVGAAAGAAVSKFAEHRLTSGIHDKIGQALPAGSAAVIGVFEDDDRLVVEQALPGSPAKSVVPMGKKGLSGLKSALAQAMGKFSPDRAVGRPVHTVDAGAL